MKNVTLGGAFYKAVGDYMLVETPLRRADACIIYGNHIHAALLAHHAADLYHKGYFGLVVASGGVAVPQDPALRTEAELTRDILCARGVPQDRILVENRARNTGENTVFSRQLLAQRGVFPACVIAVGYKAAARRFLMTLESRWPGVDKMYSAPFPRGLCRDTWHTDPAFRADVLREYAKIPRYKALGYVHEIDEAHIARRAALLPAPFPAPKYRIG